MWIEKCMVAQISLPFHFGQKLCTLFIFVQRHEFYHWLLMALYFISVLHLEMSFTCSHDWLSPSSSRTPSGAEVHSPLLFSILSDPSISSPSDTIPLCLYSTSDGENERWLLIDDLKQSNQKEGCPLEMTTLLDKSEYDLMSGEVWIYFTHITLNRI